MNRFLRARSLAGTLAASALPCVAIASELPPTAGAPLALAREKIVLPDGAAGDNLGVSLAVSGDVAAVGAPGADVGDEPGQGCVYAFRWNGSAWVEQQRLHAPNGNEGDEFGFTVATSGDVIVAAGRFAPAWVFRWNGSAWIAEQQLVGSYAVAVSGDVAITGNIGTDVATVYRWNGGEWVQEQQLGAPAGTPKGYFSNALAVSGDLAVVGAYREPVGGAAYAFRWNAGAWALEQRLTASDGESLDEFGSAVAVSGDVIVVGAPNDDVDTRTNQGSAYVFRRGGGVWTQEQTLRSPGGLAFDNFGNAVDVAGDLVVVAAYLDDILPSASAAGTASAFRWSGSAWMFEHKFIAQDFASDDGFGWSVAADGDAVLAGAPEDDVGASPGQGSVYAFRRSGTSWLEEQKLAGADQIEGGESYHGFGVRLAVSGDALVVGSEAGNAAYAYRLTGAGWEREPMSPPSDTQPSDRFGYGVSVSGDVAVVGASDDRVGSNVSQGSATVFRGDGTAWSVEQKLADPDGAASDFLGFSVAVSGDVAVAGAPGDDVGANPSQGSASVFRWDGSAWVAEQKLVAPGGAASDVFGHSVALFGDAIVVGAPGDTVGANASQGSASVFRWNGSAWVHEQTLTAADGATYASFGGAVAGSGDVIVVGATGDSDGVLYARGAAYVFRWNGSAWTQQQKLVAEDAGLFDWFGAAVAVSGGAIVVGAPYAPYQYVYQEELGAAYVFLWDGAAWAQQLKLQAFDAAIGDRFGAAVAASGDVALVGAPNADVGPNTAQGAAYAWNLADAVVDGDADGLLDADELDFWGTSPVDPDSDGDGLKDGDEVQWTATDPLDADSDGDGFDDGSEVAAGTDPNDPGSYPPAPVPSLGPTGLALLASLIGVVGLLATRRRSLA